MSIISQKPENDAFMSCEPQFLGHIKVNYYSSFSALIWNFWHILKQSLQTIIFSTTTIGIRHFFDPSSAKKMLKWALEKADIVFIQIYNMRMAKKHIYAFWLSIRWIEPFHLGHIIFFQILSQNRFVYILWW